MLSQLFEKVRWTQRDSKVNKISSSSTFAQAAQRLDLLPDECALALLERARVRATRCEIVTAKSSFVDINDCDQAELN